MATAAYYTWVRAGRPLTPAQPVLVVVTRMKSAHPAAASAGCFGWYANDAHYQAEPPEDHTPFSSTEWPIPCPRYVVFATDVMPHSSYSLEALVAWWLSEARAGRVPALKYLIHGDRIYLVWRGFVADEYRGAYHAHMHLSFRTDHETDGLGGWDPTGLTPHLPKEDDVTLTPDQEKKLASIPDSFDTLSRQEFGRTGALIGDQDTVSWSGAPTPTEQNLAKLNRKKEHAEVLAAIAKISAAPVDASAVAAALAADAAFREAIAVAVAEQLAARLAE